MSKALVLMPENIFIMPMTSLLPYRKNLCSLAVFSLLFFLSACSKSDHPLTVASHPWPSYELMFLAQSEGWLSADSVQLMPTRSATESLQALADGKVEAATLTLDEVLRARDSGTPLTIVLIMDESAGADALYVRPEIKQLADLAGKRIGVEGTAVGAILLAKVLEIAGLPQTAVTLVPVPVDQQWDSWLQGQLDAVITHEPMATQLAALGAKRLFDTRSAPDFIFDVLAIRTDVLEDHEHDEGLRHLLEGHFRALKHLRIKPQDAAFRMAARLGLTGNEVLAAFRQLELPDVDHNKRYLSSGGSTIIELASNLSKILVASGQLSKTADLVGLISNDYLPE